MNTLLAICTVLGGIAAIGYLLEKSPLHVWTHVKHWFVGAPTIPVGRASLGAYVQAHSRPKALDAAIATDRGFPVVPRDSDWEWLLEMVRGLPIETIKDLDRLVRKHFSTARRLSHYMTPQGGVPTAFGVSLVLEVEAMNRGGLQGLTDLIVPLKLTNSCAGLYKDIWEAYVQIVGNKSA